MTNEKAVAEKLLEVGAIKLSPAKPFTWASGWKSPIYCDNRRVLSFPVVRDFIRSEMCHIITEHFPGTQLLAGVATAGIAWGALVADQLKLPFIYVRPKPKEHGMGNQVEGFYEEGQKVLIVEDLISTAKSSLQVLDVLKKEHMQIEGLVSIFSYGFKQATESIKNAGIEFRSLTDYATLLSLAVEKKIIDAQNKTLLGKWSEDPANWQGI